jgi:hypothetical protein
MATRSETKANGDILPRRIMVNAFVPGTSAATAGNYGVFFTADSPITQIDSSAAGTEKVYEVVSVKERHETAGSDAGAVTLMLKKVPSGTAKGFGTDMLSAGINLKATADTIQTGALSATTANLRLAPGDSLALVTTGTLTALVGVHVQVELKRIDA